MTTGPAAPGRLVLVTLLVIGALSVPEAHASGITDTGDVVDTSSFLVVGSSGTGQRTIDGVANGPYPTVTVGQFTGSTGTLVVTNPGGALTKTGGAGAGIFTIGESGSGSVTVSSGGTISNAGFTGLGTASGGSGSLTVTGAGSTWTSSSSGMVVGLRGPGTLAVSSGGVLNLSSTTDGFLTIGSNDPSAPVGATGTATVSGAGSQINAGVALLIGGSRNGTLTISGGGKVADGVGATGGIFSTFGDASSATGTVTVTGAGSQLNLRDTVTIGNQGTGSVTVANGGAMNVGAAFNHNMVVGNQAGSAGTLAISGGGTFTQGASATGATIAVVGGDAGATGTLNITDAGSTATFGSALAIGIRGKGVATVADGAVLNVSGAFGGSLGIGLQSGSDGSMVVSGGGKVIEGAAATGATTVAVGSGSGSTGALTVTGAGSQVMFRNAIVIGDAGTGTVTVSNGGALNVASTFGGNSLLGVQPGSVGTLNVTDAGSTATFGGGGGLYIGWQGKGTANISNGGVLTLDGASNNTMFIGNQSGSTGVLAVSSGGKVVEGALATAATFPTIGLFAGSTGTLSIAGPGAEATFRDSLWIGGNGKGIATVTDGGTLTINSAFNGPLSIGSGSGADGALTVSGGGKVVQGALATAATFAGVGNAAGSTGTLLITGAGSEVTFRNHLGIADAGKGSVTVADGGTLTVNSAFNGGLQIGNQTGSVASLFVSGGGKVFEGVLATAPTFPGMAGQSGSTATLDITDPGSAVTFRNGFVIGNLGKATATVANGGTLIVNGAFNNGLVVGNQAGSTGTLTVSGGGKLFQGALGTTGGSNGVVGGDGGAIGFFTVTGAGSEATFRNQLTVGANGKGTATVADGAVVSVNGAFNGSLAIANQPNSQGSLTISGGGKVLEGALATSGTFVGVGAGKGSTGDLTITGAGSELVARNGMSIANAGKGSATVTNGGALTVNGAFNNGIVVGVQSGSTGSLTVSGGGKVTDGALTTPGTTFATTFGDSAGSAGTLLITDPGSSMTARNGLNVGRLGTGTATVTNGGVLNVNGALNGSLQVGSGGTGTLTVSNGGKVAEGALAGAATFGGVGGPAGSTGTLNITDPGSEATYRNGLTVANFGKGTVDVANGGMLTVNGSFNGTIVIGNQTGSNGALTVSSGGKVVEGALATAATFVTVGSLAGSTGALTITDPGSTATVRNGLTVGNFGAGTLTVSNGGVVDVNGAFTNSVTVGGRAGSVATATVIGAGSRLNVNSVNAIGVGNGNNADTPGSALNATLNVQAGGVVTAPRLVIASNLSSATAAVNVSGAGSQIHLTGQSAFQSSGFNRNEFTAGFGGSGTVNVSNGGSILIEATEPNHRATMSLGGINTGTGNSRGIGGAGTMTVSGTGSEVRLKGGDLGFFQLGAGDANFPLASFPQAVSSGTLNVLNGGKVVIEDGTSSKNGSLVAGRLEGGTGTVMVSGAGSEISIAGNLFLGHKVGADPAGAGTGSGTVTVTNGGKVSADRVNLGNGTLTVSAGGLLKSSTGTIGDSSSHVGIVTVTGAGTNWDVSGPIPPGSTRNFVTVGNNGVGTLNVAGGAQVTLDSGTTPAGPGSSIGFNAGAVGTVNISGAGSKIELKGLANPALPDPNVPGFSLGSGINVGANGSGTLNVTGGGALVLNAVDVNTSQRTGAVQIARNPGSTGAALVSGAGSLIDAPIVRVALAPGDVAGGTGVLTISDGGKVKAGQLTIGAGGTVNGSGGTIEGNVTVLPGGTLAPGLSPGTMSILGSLDVQAGGILELQAFSTGHDMLDVSGLFTAEAGSLIKIELDTDVAPGTVVTLLQTQGGDTLGVTKTAGGFEVEAAGAFEDLLAANPGLLVVEQGQFDGVGSVPLPASLALILCGVALAIVRQRLGVVHNGRGRAPRS